MSSSVFYAVAYGKTKGIFTTWTECEKSIKNFPNAKFRKFASKEDAEQFVKTGNIPTNTKKNNSNNNTNTTTTKSKYSDINFESDSDSDSDVGVSGVSNVSSVITQKSKTNLQSQSKTYNSTFINVKNEEKSIRENINFDTDTDTDSNTDSDEIISTHTQTQSYPTEIGDFKPDIIVYTDGACASNGKPNAKAGIGVYFGANDPRNISAQVQGKQSNNTGELNALISAYKTVEQEIQSGKNVAFFTDSVYSLRCLTTYGDKCSQSNWNKNIPNKELVKQAYELFKFNNSPNIKLIHVRAHTGAQDTHSLGNEQADYLANLAIGINLNTTINQPTQTTQTTPPTTPTQPNTDKKIYLKIAFEKKELAKKLGCRWDPDVKKWYCNESNKKALDQFGVKV